MQDVLQSHHLMLKGALDKQAKLHCSTAIDAQCVDTRMRGHRERARGTDTELWERGGQRDMGRGGREGQRR
jgi:hypothetical protein